MGKRPLRFGRETPETPKANLQLCLAQSRESAMPQGVCRVKNGHGDQHSVWVQYGRDKKLEVSESYYRESEYSPPFDELPWCEDAQRPQSLDQAGELPLLVRIPTKLDALDSPRVLVACGCVLSLSAFPVAPLTASGLSRSMSASARSPAVARARTGTPRTSEFRPYLPQYVLTPF